MYDQRFMKFGILGSVLVFGGYLFGWHGVPMLLNYCLSTQYALVNGTFQYPMWLDLPVPIDFNIYFFNVTNPEDVHNGSRPILNEIGPFCYNLHRDKVVLDVSEDKVYLTYYNRRTFYPTMERPGCLAHSTQVTILNMALMGTVHIINGLSPDLLSTFQDAIPFLYPGIKDIFLTDTAEAILFNGVKLDCSSEDFTLKLICGNIQTMAPPQLWKHPNNQDYLFAAFKYLNGSLEGPFKINTGINNSSLIGNTIEWKGKTELDNWRSKECNEIKGTDGYVVFPLNGASNIVLFQSDVCRTLTSGFEYETEVSGLSAIKFGGKHSLDATEENKCYCPKNFNHDKNVYEVQCLKNGILNLSPCVMAPVIMSWPHLLWADPEYTNYSIGLKPDQEKHEAAVYYEPITSSPLKGFKRGQMNMFLIKSDDITVLNNVSEGLFPMFWLEEGTSLPPNFLLMLKIAVYSLKVFNYLKYILIAFGLTVLGYSMFLFTKEKNKVHNITTTNQELPVRRQFQNNFEQDIATFSILELAKSSRVPQTGLVDLQNNQIDNKY